jgi:tripeptide aminopeptidase
MCTDSRGSKCGREDERYRMRQELLDRFFRYVNIDTQSQEDVEDVYPSTEKQKDLSRLLVAELKALGLEDAEMDGHGTVMATVPGNLSKEDASRIPIIGFLAHVDTSPEVSGKNVKPVLHRDYRGGDIVLPGDPSQVIREDENPALKDFIGDDIVTSNGTTLLGADDKAGIAEMMTMVAFLVAHPEIKHGALRIGFTPDEEVGNGTKYFDVNKFGADFAYTVDGGRLGEVENECFNAAVAVFTITGVHIHPGYAKGKLVNAVRIAADILKEMDTCPAPETTEKREGFFHPYWMEGGSRRMMLKVLLRDFEKQGLFEKAHRIGQIQGKMEKKYPRAKIHAEVKESYGNMRLHLEKEPRVVAYAAEAVRSVGVEPRLTFIRGGTDGAKLCELGLLTPNLFTGGINPHSTMEWIPVGAMVTVVETLVSLIHIWTEKGLSEA